MCIRDRSKDSWDWKYWNYAYCNSVISGFEDGTARPNDNVTYAQFVKMLDVYKRQIYSIMKKSSKKMKKSSKKMKKSVDKRGNRVYNNQVVS